MKKFILFFICVPLVYSELHSFMTAYTAINGQTTAGTPEFSAVTTLDEKQIYYNDSKIKKLIPRQDWVKKITSTELWKEYIDIREKLQQIYKINVHVIMQRFTQSDGVHTYQWMYGCKFDDETEDSQVFDQHAYDGEDFISLDLKEDIYITPVAQANTTVMMWNNAKTQLRYLKQYYDRVCVDWLKDFLHLSKATEPEVSLLQKIQDYYVECHVTGFLFRNTSILWRKNGQTLRDSRNLKSGDTRPNEDGTFQRTVALYVLPEEWKKDRYSCVVEHKSLTETIQKILTEDQIMRSKYASNAPYIMNPALVIPFSVGLIVLMVLIGLCVRLKLWKKLKGVSKKKIIYFKTKPSQEQTPSQESLLGSQSNKSVNRESAALPGSFTENNTTSQNHDLHSSSPVDQSSQPSPTTLPNNPPHQSSTPILPNNPPQQPSTTTLHTNPPQQPSTTTLHNNPPQQSSPTTLHNNPPQQPSTTTLHNNPPHQSSPTTLHNNPPQQPSTTILPNNPPQQPSPTTLHNNPPHQSSPTTLHNNPPQQPSTPILPNNPPQQPSTPTLHNKPSTTTLPNNPPQQPSTPILHNNPPQQPSTPILPNNPPQQPSPTTLPNNPPQQPSTPTLHNKPSTTTLPNNPPQQPSPTTLPNNPSTTTHHDNHPQQSYPTTLHDNPPRVLL